MRIKGILPNPGSQPTDSRPWAGVPSLEGTGDACWTECESWLTRLSRLRLRLKGQWRYAAIYVLAACLMAFAASPVPAQTAGAAPKQAPAAVPPQIAADPGDKPYDSQLFRLAEILGTLHYLRELCGANEGQVWREHMRELAASEGTSALRRAKFVESFNRGYRDYSRTYRACTQPALVAIQRFMDQAAAIADGLVTNEK